MGRIVATFVVLTTTVAFATDLNLSAQSGGSSAITVGPGCQVDYSVIGELSDNLNEGLALAGFDLVFSGGDLVQANEPMSGSVANFTIPDGITNPAGYGGTVINGDLIQVGGGQNTINNDALNATFPVGSVITGVAAMGAPETLATGSLTSPLADGVYTLTIANAFANVITQGQDGNPFWASEQAGIGAPTALTITVDSAATCPLACSIASTTPPSGAIDARFPHDRDDASIVFGWNSFAITMTCNNAATAAPQDFVVTEVAGTNLPAGVVVDGVPPTIMAVSPLAGDQVQITLDQPIAPGAWTVIEFGGTKACFGFLPGDVNQSRGANAQDISAVVDHLNSVPGRIQPLYAVDVNRSNAANAQDISEEVNILNGASALAIWNSAALGASPCD